MRIREINVTPVAFRDPPLLNAAGVHEPWALRTIVEVVTDEGLTGLGETYGDFDHLVRVRDAARALVGHDVRRVLALAALLGPLLLLTADVVGRVVARPAEVQVGVVTAVLGTPLFILLARRGRARAGT